MKKAFYFYLYILLGFTLNAQERAPITSAGGTSIGEAYLVQDIISVKEHGFLVFQSYILNQQRELEFQIYDLSRTLTNRQIFHFDSTLGEPLVQGYLEWHGHFILLVSYYQEITNTNELYLYKYSLPELTLLSEVKIMEAYRPATLNVPFLNATSPDESKFAIAAWSYAIPKDPAKIDLVIFDETLSIVREEKYIFPYKNEKIYLDKILVNNNATPYLIGKTHGGSSIDMNYQERGILEGMPFILAFLSPQNAPNLYEIDARKHKFPLLEFNFNPQQELVGLGFYTSGGKKSFTGTCAFTISPEKKALKINTSEFSKDMFDNALDGNPSVMKNASLRNAHIKDIILKDNNYFLVGEYIRVDTKRESNSIISEFHPTLVYHANNYDAYNNYDFTSEYFLLDIFVIKLNKNGNTVWMKRIPKNQYLEEGKSKKYMSFSVLERKRDLLLFYNDHPDNFTFKPKDKVKKTKLKTAVPMLAKVRYSSGKITKRKLVSLFGKNAIIRPDFCKTIDEERVFMYGQKRKWNLTAYRMKVAKLGGD